MRACVHVVCCNHSWAVEIASYLDYDLEINPQPNNLVYLAALCLYKHAHVPAKCIRFSLIFYTWQKGRRPLEYLEQSQRMDKDEMNYSPDGKKHATLKQMIN